MITINNPVMAGPVVNALASFFEQACSFHESLMRQGVKAYRCNDGWVDRENHTITFFERERDEGYYWSDLDLQPGDLIYIGCASDPKGSFAEIVSVVTKNGYKTEYEYKIIHNNGK